MSPASPLVLPLLGERRSYALVAPPEGTTLVSTNPATGAEVRLLLATVQRARLSQVGALRICELSLEGGGVQSVSTDEGESHGAFTELVRALYKELTPRVPFSQGSWGLAAFLAALFLAVAAVGLAIWLGYLPPPIRTGASWLPVVAVLFGPFVVAAARPKRIENVSALEKWLAPVREDRA